VRRFRYLSVRLTHFWNRRRREYLANLREFHRNKVRKDAKPVQVGDVVTVFEENRKRGDWNLGVLESLIKGKDDVVRGANIRVITKGKALRMPRSVQKLYPLEVRSATFREGELQRCKRKSCTA